MWPDGGEDQVGVGFARAHTRRAGNDVARLNRRADEDDRLTGERGRARRLCCFEKAAGQDEWWPDEERKP